VKIRSILRHYKRDMTLVTTEVLGATALEGLVARGCDVPGHEGWLAIDQVGVLAPISKFESGSRDVLEFAASRLTLQVA